MSFQFHVESLINSGKFTSAAMFANTPFKTEVLARSEGFNFTTTDAIAIVQALNRHATLPHTTLNLVGLTFTVTSADPKTIHARSTSCSIMVIKTAKHYIVGLHAVHIDPVEAEAVVEKLTHYLTNTFRRNVVSANRAAPASARNAPLRR
eukprot:TRINITY_DN555_c0_g1_i1.p1 TRINITY_DN555_c0_g1~~TRINITY_DN555_c0_g1_i1.p1  ORF type:complete len:150 (+),score=52.27 TRINITY_DN555_c0_g1_i1:84-533(+)